MSPALDLRDLISTIPYLPQLRAAGEVYLVGGAVRDYLMGKKSNDFDIVVKGSAREFLSRLRGVKARLVELSPEDDEYRLVLAGRVWLDIAGMKGETLEEDLKKRDFTVNSIAIPLNGFPKFIDPTGGRRDIKRKIVRTWRKRNLKADPLRLLRAFRFTSELGFSIEEKTKRWISSLKGEIRKPKAERIRYELFRLFAGKRVHETVWLMNETSILTELFPELEPLRDTCQKYYEEQNLLYHTLKCVEYLELLLRGDIENPCKEVNKYCSEFLKSDKNRALLFMGALFHDIGKPETLVRDEEGRTHFYGHDRLGEKIVAEMALRLRFSKEETKTLSQIVRFHMYPHLLAREGEKITDRALFRYLKRTGDLAFPLILLAFADAMASPPEEKGLEGHVAFARRLIDFLEKRREIEKKVRLVTGDDLIRMGLKPGPIFRVILDEMEELQAIGRFKTREEALQVLEEVVQKHINNRVPSESADPSSSEALS